MSRSSLCVFAICAGALASHAAHAQTAAPSETTCAPGWETRVHDSLQSSVAKIESGGGLGAGFVYASPLHIATAFHVVSSGRPLTVTFADGHASGADVVAIDRENDLAIVQLRTPDPSAVPLRAANGIPPVGTPVVAIGHPFGIADRIDERLRGLLTWSVTAGIVSGRTDRLIQTDAAINPGNSGGPLLRCDGRVLGVVSEKLIAAEGISLAVSVQHLERLVGEIGKQEVYTGSFDLGYPALGFVLVPESGYSWLGISFGLGGVWTDRWELRLDAAWLWAAGFDDPSPLRSRGGSAMLAEVSLDYRVLLLESPFPLYFTPTLGVSAFKRTLTETNVKIGFDDPACPQSGNTCATHADASTTEDTHRMFRPFAGAGIRLAGATVSYAFHLGVTGDRESDHRIFIGFAY